MKKTLLIIVNTPFQMITAIQLTCTEYKDYVVDVIITDNIAQYEELAKRAKKSKVFEHVYSVKTKGVKWNNWKYTMFPFIFGKMLERKMPFINGMKYDVFLFANTGGVSACIASFLNSRYGTVLGMFEDGFVSYSEFYYKEIKDAINPKSIPGKIIYCLRRRAPAYIKYYYVFEPKLICDWDFQFVVKRIPKIKREMLIVLNEVFGYDKHAENYNYKYIFFEESYYADGIDVDDVMIVKEIASIVGKDNLLIKLHPRNPQNRFRDFGFYTNNDTSLPWEVIALNCEIGDKILVTIASGSSITSYFISDQKAKCSLLLYEMNMIEREKLTPSLEVFDKICKNNEYFVYPQNTQQLKQILLGE